LRYRAQFDRSELGVPYINDCNLIPINSQGANWELFKSSREPASPGQNKGESDERGQESMRGGEANGLSLANEIRNQMIYYKVLRDKHDNSLINTLQDLNNMIKTGQGATGSDGNGHQRDKINFVKFEHTKFSDQNKKAMALLIILLERKNEILKNLSRISNQRQQLINQQQKLQQLIKQQIHLSQSSSCP